MTLLIIFILFFLFFLIGTIFVIIGSYKRKGRMGINTDSIIVCPRCGETLPKFRKPTSLRQTLWGGWTCKKCGCEVDKWGKEIKKQEE